MDDTPRFALPFIAPGQAQKELFHNEALQRIDFLLCPVVEEPPRVAPPAAPLPGQAFIAASGATGAWAGHDGEIAGYSEGGWRFISAGEGASVVERTSGEVLLRRGGAWEAGIVRGQELRVAGTRVVGPRQAAIATPSGGANVDAEARAAIASILGALRGHGLITP